MMPDSFDPWDAPPIGSIVSGLDGVQLVVIGADPTPAEAARLARRVSDYTAPANMTWDVLSDVERARHGNDIDRWWRAFGEDNRISTRASFAAMKAEIPGHSLAQARQWWGSLGKDARQSKRRKYTKGYGSNVFTDITKAIAPIVRTVAPMVQQAVRQVPVYGPIMAEGAKDWQKVLTDPSKAPFALLGPGVVPALARMPQGGKPVNFAAATQQIAQQIPQLQRAAPQLAQWGQRAAPALSLVQRANQGDPRAKAFVARVAQARRNVGPDPRVQQLFALLQDAFAALQQPAVRGAVSGALARTCGASFAQAGAGGGRWVAAADGQQVWVPDDTSAPLRAETGGPVFDWIKSVARPVVGYRGDAAAYTMRDAYRSGIDAIG